MPTSAEILETLIDQSMARDIARFRDRLNAVARRPDNDPSWGKLLDDVNRSRDLRERRLKLLPTIQYPPDLPVSQAKDEILAAIRDHQVIVLAGETGSGKTTQLPKICLELGRGVAGTIGHTQPRRIAARSVSARIAEELGSSVGNVVGFKVRFTDQSRDESLIKVMTDGILLAETQSDPLLTQYDTIIIDEAHERSLNIDFLLGYLKQLLPNRPDLKLIITSATIDPHRFSRHFSDAPMIEVSGRTYPVEVRYRPMEPDEPELDDNGNPVQSPPVDPIDAIATAVDEVRRESASGDVLVFLASEREIRESAIALAERLPAEWDILPLYARLSVEDQQRVFKPGHRRRVVLATNVAETSITVPNIVYVIDPGEARISRYNPRTKVQRLPIEPISQASANQRKGRCGRVAPGVCVRLYSQADFDSRPPYTDPEVMRTNLASVILQMIALKLGEVGSFPFLDPPDTRQIRDGYTTLYELGAVSPPEGVLANAGDGRQYVLTELGRRLARIPADPRIGRMIVAGLDEGVLDEVLVIAAALSVQDPRDRPLEHAAAADAAHATFSDPTSDFVGFLKMWNAYREKSHQLTTSKLRKWCRDHFLSYSRLREWQETHRQLRTLAAESLAERRGAFRQRRNEFRHAPRDNNNPQPQRNPREQNHREQNQREQNQRGNRRQRGNRDQRPPQTSAPTPPPLPIDPNVAPASPDSTLPPTTPPPAPMENRNTDHRSSRGGRGQRGHRGQRGNRPPTDMPPIANITPAPEPAIESIPQPAPEVTSTPVESPLPE